MILRTVFEQYYCRQQMQGNNAVPLVFKTVSPRFFLLSDSLEFQNQLNNENYEIHTSVVSLYDWKTQNINNKQLSVKLLFSM